MVEFAEEYLRQFRTLMPTGRLPGNLKENAGVAPPRYCDRIGCQGFLDTLREAAEDQPLPRCLAEKYELRGYTCRYQ